MVKKPLRGNVAEIVKSFQEVMKYRNVTPPEESILQSELGSLEDLDTYAYITHNPATAYASLLELEFTSDDIELRGMKFGKFLVKFGSELNGGTNEYRIKVSPLTPNYSKIMGEVSHPHVEKTTICLGDGKVPFSRAVKAGRYGDAVDIVNSVLNTYGEGRAYVELKNWNGWTCDNCEGICLERPGKCNHCKQNLCSACTHRCFKCKILKHEACNILCEICKDNSCSSCKITLRKRNILGCVKCAKTCGNCGEYNHPDDLLNRYCVDCRYRECSSCYANTERHTMKNGKCQKCQVIPCINCKKSVKFIDTISGTCKICISNSVSCYI